MSIWFDKHPSTPVDHVHMGFCNFFHLCGSCPYGTTNLLPSLSIWLDKLNHEEQFYHILISSVDSDGLFKTVCEILYLLY